MCRGLRPGRHNSPPLGTTRLKSTRKPTRRQPQASTTAEWLHRGCGKRPVAHYIALTRVGQSGPECRVLKTKASPTFHSTEQSRSGHTASANAVMHSGQTLCRTQAQCRTMLRPNPAANVTLQRQTWYRVDYWPLPSHNSVDLICPRQSCPEFQMTDRWNIRRSAKPKF